MTDVDVEQATESWDELLKQHGLRVTSARVVVLDVLHKIEHGTPEEIFEHAAPHLPALSVSTVYRTLESLSDCGVVAHTHLDQASPSYMLASHADHAHLVCRNCGSVTQVEQAIVTKLVNQIADMQSFEVDAGHLSIFGTCIECAQK